MCAVRVLPVILNEAAGVVKDLVERNRPVILNGVKALCHEDLTCHLGVKNPGRANGKEVTDSSLSLRMTARRHVRREEATQGVG